MKRTIALFMMVASAVLFSTTLFAQTVYYVQSVKAKVQSGPSFKSKVIGEVGKGFKFVSSGRDGNWVKVKLDTKDGYVSALLLATHPPIQRAGVIKGEEGEIKEGVRRRASSYTSAAAARGLAQDDRRRLSREEKADYPGLEKMEAFTVSDAELNKFLEGGK
jgi:uncharacterized protein YgiM (DUF1202 family)